MSTPVTLVWGPPCAGKSTWALERAGVRSLVADFDRLGQAVACAAPYETPPEFVPFVMAARDAVLDRLAGQHAIEDAFIVACVPERSKRDEICGRWNAEAVLLDPGKETCHERADAAGRPALWHLLIEDWYRRVEI